jgi:hypothetical protein
VRPQPFRLGHAEKFCSSYSGGVLLNQIKSDLPSTEVYALVRTPEQAEKVQSLGAHPVQFDLKTDGEQIAKTVVDNEGTIPKQSHKNNINTKI